MTLFSNQDNLIKDLCKFSQTFNNAVYGMSCNVLSKDTLGEWGASSDKYSHSYGRDLEYKGIKFWAGLGIKNNKVITFIVHFKPGTKSTSQIYDDTNPMDEAKFNEFCQTGDDNKPLQWHILTALRKFEKQGE